MPFKYQKEGYTMTSEQWTNTSGKRIYISDDDQTVVFEGDPQLEQGRRTFVLLAGVDGQIDMDRAKQLNLDELVTRGAGGVPGKPEDTPGRGPERPRHPIEKGVGPESQTGIGQESYLEEGQEEEEKPGRESSAKGADRPVNKSKTAPPNKGTG